MEIVVPAILRYKFIVNKDARMSLKSFKQARINKILVVGHPLSGYESVTGVLNTAGMNPAKPSKREGMNPEEISATLLKTQQYPLVSGNEINQLSLSPVWNGLALDLMLGNIDQSLWCWADSQAVSLLDFWKSLDSQLAFVLVYDSPQQFLARSFNETQSLTPNALQNELSSWMAYNQTLLKFYHHNRDRSLLLHSQQIHTNGTDYLEYVRSQIGIPLLTDTALSGAECATIVPNLMLESFSPDDSLYTYLARDILQHYPDVLELYEELQSMANLPSDTSESSIATASDAWSAAVASKLNHRQKLQASVESAQQLQKEKQNLETTLQKTKQAHDEQTKESELLLSQLHIVQEQLEQQHIDSKKQIESFNQNLTTMTKEKETQYKLAQDRHTKIEALSKENEEKIKLAQEHQKQIEILKPQLEALKKERDALIQQPKNPEMEKENELLLSQLHQVQEELERYYLQTIELKQNTRISYANTYEADRIKGHLSYRLGKVMVEARTPLNWLKLPWRLRRAYKEYKQERKNG